MSDAAATPNSNQPPAGQTASLSAGEIVIDLAIASVGDEAKFEAPKIVKIMPRGKTVTRDDRAYDFKPEMLVARFEEDGIDIPIDMEHGLSAFMGDKSQGAVGWISKLEARDDGLYGHVDWLKRGIEVLKARTHRFLSPTFRHDAFGQAKWLHSAALVAAPALAMAALAHADPNTIAKPPETSMTKMARLAAELGLTEDASEDALLQALAAKTNGMVAKNVHDETLSKLSATTGELEALRAASRKAEVDAALEDALKAKKIAPAEREHFEKLAATDEGLDQVKALLGAMTSKQTPSGLDGKRPPTTDKDVDAGNLSPVQLAAKAQAYQNDMAQKGVTVSAADAVDHVSAERAA